MKKRSLEAVVLSVRPQACIIGYCSCTERDVLSGGKICQNVLAAQYSHQKHMTFPTDSQGFFVITYLKEHILQFQDR